MLACVNIAVLVCLIAGVYEHGYACVVCVRARFFIRLLLEKRCADVLQPDITWVGGITEARRVVALASAFDVPVSVHRASG